MAGLLEIGSLKLISPDGLVEKSMSVTNAGVFVMPDSAQFTGTIILPNTTSIGDVSATEISYLDGVTSNIQTQVNGKANSASPTFTGTVTIPTLEITTKLISEETMTLALSDETTVITTGTAKLTFRMPFAAQLTKIPRASLTNASTSGNPTVDINKNGASILSTKLSIDANEKTSVTAAIAAVLSSSSIADDDELTFDIDTAGTGAKGLKITLYYKRV